MKIKRNKKSYKWFLCGLILVVVLTISYRVSKANYRISNSIELTTGKVVSSPYDFNIVSMYIDGVEQEKETLIPTSDGYIINKENSYCYKESKNNKDNNVKLYTDELGNHVFSGISKGSKCILYFEKNKIESSTTIGELLEKYYIYKKVRSSKNKEFNVPFGETTKNTVYISSDNDGITYYFAGNPLDNWVEFGGYYWRIIRVNGDGSIRMIYQGRTEDENGKRLEPQATGEETQIGTSTFNDLSNDNAYVGFMYGTPNSSTYEETHENKNDSTIKQVLDNWFSNSKIRQGTSYFNLIDFDAGFCVDRIPSTTLIPTNEDNNSRTVNIGNGSGGTGTTTTFYGAYLRLVPKGIKVTLNTTRVTPTYNCGNNEDLYTYNYPKQTKGNKKLINPVGLIISDEVAYAGMIMNWEDASARTKENYLYNGKHYWTMSPLSFEPGYANPSLIFRVDSSGSLNWDNSISMFGIRPVINLRSDVTFTGNGTQYNPFKVVVS